MKKIGSRWWFGAMMMIAAAAMAPRPAEAACVTAYAGQGWVTISLTATTKFDVIEFTATPSQAGLDGVVGFSTTNPTNFNSLQGAVRFSTANVIDAYDTNGYRADVSQSYVANTAYSFRTLVDMTQHRYSVFQGGGSTSLELGKQYAFRSSQANATSVGAISAIVDGPSGSLTLCASNQAPSAVAYTREAIGFNVLPFDSGEMLMANGANTQRLSTAGKVLSTISASGAMGGTADHFAIASLSGGNVVVNAYDHYALAWTSSTPIVGSASSIDQVLVDANNAVTLATSGGGLIGAYAFGSTGATLSSATYAGQLGRIAGSHIVTIASDSTQVVVTSYNADTSVLWQQTFLGNAPASAMTLDGEGGIVFAGEISSAINFGGSTLPKPPTPETGRRDIYIAKLAANGAHVFSKRTDTTLIGGLAATSNRILLSTTRRTQFHYILLQQFDLAGNALSSTPNVGLIYASELYGRARNIAVSPNGHAWWEIETMWPLFSAWNYAFALTSL